MKKVFIVALSVIMFLTVSTTSVFAQTGSSSLKDNKVELGQELVIDASTEGISDVLTYEELVSEVANDQNISKEQARNELTSSLYGTSGKVVNKSSVAAATTATYRTISTSVSVTSTYKPQIRYYCQTDEGGGSFRAIKKILKVSLNRSYNGKSKQFSGEIYTKLEDPNKKFYILNGDFYNNGTTTYNGSLNIGIGKYGSVSFGVSHATSWYKYKYQEGYKYF